MKKSLCFLLTLTALCLLALNAFAAGLSFSDVKETDWFAEAVTEAAALGLINGKGVDSSGRNYFDPDGNITLAEAVKLAACMHQRSAEGAVTLTNGNPWYESYADYGRDRFLAASGKGAEARQPEAGFITMGSCGSNSFPARAVGEYRNNQL